MKVKLNKEMEILKQTEILEIKGSMRSIIMDWIESGLGDKIDELQ